MLQALKETLKETRYSLSLQSKCTNEESDQYDKMQLWQWAFIQSENFRSLIHYFSHSLAHKLKCDLCYIPPKHALFLRNS